MRRGTTSQTPLHENNDPPDTKAQQKRHTYCLDVPRCKGNGGSGGAKSMRSCRRTTPHLAALIFPACPYAKRMAMRPAHWKKGRKQGRKEQRAHRKPLQCGREERAGELSRKKKEPVDDPGSYLPAQALTRCMLAGTAATVAVGNGCCCC